MHLGYQLALLYIDWSATGEVREVYKGVSVTSVYTLRNLVARVCEHIRVRAYKLVAELQLQVCALRLVACWL